MSSLKVLAILFLVASTLGVEQDSDIDGESPVDFEHENILGSHKLATEFHTLDEAESRKRLEEILIQMDIDGDKNITQLELTDWILKSLKKLDEEEVFESFNKSDVNQDSGVTWDEFLKVTYHTDKEKLANLELLYPNESAELIKQVQSDEQKFNLADEDMDGKLTITEFAAMIHPYHFDYMNVAEVERVKKQYDLDGNGKISKVEFLSYGIEERQDLDAYEFKDQQDALRDEFESLDADNNGLLDQNEIKEWVAPGLEGVAKQEAEYILAQTDANKNGRLTFEEILVKTNQWVGSKGSAPHLHTFHHEAPVVQTQPDAQPQAAPAAAPAAEQAAPRVEL